MEKRIIYSFTSELDPGRFKTPVECEVIKLLTWKKKFDSALVSFKPEFKKSNWKIKAKGFSKGLLYLTPSIFRKLAFMKRSLPFFKLKPREWGGVQVFEFNWKVPPNFEQLEAFHFYELLDKGGVILKSGKRSRLDELRFGKDIKKTDSFR